MPIKHFVHSHSPKKHAHSFKFAFKGLLHALLNEANFRVEVVIAAITVAMGIHFNIQNLEWAVIILSLGFLLTAEMVNTVVEEFIDHLIKEHHEGARIIKDLSAGFVLVTAFTYLFIFALIFGDRLSTLFAF